jgi:hypothetical protein
MTVETPGRASAALVVCAGLASLGAAAAPPPKESPLDTIIRLAAHELMLSNENSAVGQLRSLLIGELAGGQAQLPSRDGYTFKVYRAARAPAAGFAYTATPAKLGRTGIHGFCADSTGRVCYSPDGTEPRVAGHRCAPSCRDLPREGLTALLPRPRLSREEKRALLAAIDTDPQMKGLPGAQLEAFRGLVRQADTADGPVPPAAQAHAGAVFALAFPDNRSLASAALEDPAIKLWSLDGSPPRRLTSERCTGATALLSPPSSRALVAACSRGLVKLWATPGTGAARDLTDVSASMVALDISADGATLLVAGRERIELWTLPAGRPRATIRLPGSPLRTVGAISPDGARVVLAPDEASPGGGSMTLWDASTGKTVGTLESPGKASATALRYTGDGRHVLAGCRTTAWPCGARRRAGGWRAPQSMGRSSTRWR